MSSDHLKPKALIIDEHKSWRKVLTRYCSAYGLSTFEVHSFDEARELMRSTAFSIIVMDMISSDEIDTSDSDWVHSEYDQFLTEIRIKSPQTPVVLISGSNSILQKRSLLRNKNPVEVILKEKSPDEIADEIGRFIGSSLSSSVDAPLRHATSIFVVHGRDKPARDGVTEVINDLDLEAIVLSDQLLDGSNILESIEEYSSATYIVVLLTPDDVGFLKTEPDATELRARQNVIFELGFCMGKLGRARVFPLFIEGAVLPSDVHGIRYVEMDDDGDWKNILAENIKSRFAELGIDIDIGKYED